MFTNNTNIPLSLAVFLASDDYDYNPEPNTISGTSILKPIRSLILSAMYPPKEASVDLADLIPSSIGSAIHTAIEASWKSDNLPSVLKALGYRNNIIDRIKINPKPSEVTDMDIPIYMEIRGARKLGKYTITGKFDFVADGTLEDFKTTGTYNWINQSNKDKYIKQGSIYRWIHRDIITSDYMKIQYIFTDWSAIKAKTDKNYPPKRFIEETYTLMSLAETEAYIRSKLAKIEAYIGKPQSEMPMCTKEDLWQDEPVYKYYKDPSKKERSTKNFDSYHEAHSRFLKDGSVGEIVEVKSQAKACRYCTVAGVCDQAKQLINEGLLII